MFYHTPHHYTLLNILNGNKPQAVAQITGNTDYPDLYGTVKFFPIHYKGVLVEAEVFHLPTDMNSNRNAFFGFHIHENGDCTDNFENTGGHFDPAGADHPFHAGDMPPLMSNDGYAWMVFLDSRITIPEILNRSVIIHSMPDDFTTQPSGNAGEKIGCGIIMLF